MDQSQQSKKLVEHYLLSKSSFKTIITKDQFKLQVNKVNKSVDDSTIDELYNLLAFQNNKRVKEISRAIKQDFQISDINKDLTNKTANINTNASFSGEEEFLLQSADKETLESVVQELELLNDCLGKEIQIVESQSSQILQNINSTIDELSDLKYGKLLFMSSIEEACKSLENLEQNIINKVSI
ncbi:hypothetical protein PACTADRAFT_49696 [Pachysolen tannophilus NRRL Y-2460]|uniref:Uncharacterized protein n=1 Tax=Pachysolen tannophilus NRRL Y-2460 TaxID=669874 RepID=A0A1E4TX65_PACTA|nr:hypothetical protein PACTADRAFT_49696 [Pachysolen tannophilus NRRL Y-2460]